MSEAELYQRLPHFRFSSGRCATVTAGKRGKKTDAPPAGGAAGKWTEKRDGPRTCGSLDSNPGSRPSRSAGYEKPRFRGASRSWRRERDSNPRWSYKPHTPLAGERLQPLGHLSVNSIVASVRRRWRSSFFELTTLAGRISQKPARIPFERLEVKPCAMIDCFNCAPGP